jgi:hypothetical protein
MFYLCWRYFQDGETNGSSNRNVSLVLLRWFVIMTSLNHDIAHISSCYRALNSLKYPLWDARPNFSFTGTSAGPLPSYFVVVRIQNQSVKVIWNRIRVFNDPYSILGGICQYSGRPMSSIAIQGCFASFPRRILPLQIPQSCIESGINFGRLKLDRQSFAHLITTYELPHKHFHGHQ